MADTYEIPIYLKPVERGSGGVNGQGEEYLPMQSQDGMDEEQQAAVDSSKSRTNPAKAIAMKMAKQAASTALNNYGNITGDYVTQNNVQTLIGEAASLGAAVALGPTGIALYAVDKVFQGYNYIAQLKRSEAESAFKQKRVYAADRRS